MLCGLWCVFVVVVLVCCVRFDLWCWLFVDGSCVLLLFVVCCLLFGVCSCVVCCGVFVVRLRVVCCLVLFDDGLLCVRCCALGVVCCLLFVACCVLVVHLLFASFFDVCC